MALSKMFQNEQHQVVKSPNIETELGVSSNLSFLQESKKKYKSTLEPNNNPK